MHVHYQDAEDHGLLHCFLSFIFSTPTEMSVHMFLPSLFYYAELFSKCIPLGGQIYYF